ncbi:ABC transporter permease, partial [Bacteroidota bacterium]
GLAVGIASCILILLFIQDELSYDKYHEKANRIFRVHVEGRLAEDEFRMAVSCAPLAYTLLEEYPEVEAVTRVRNYGFPVFRYGDKAFSEEEVYWVDSTFFDVFSVKFLEGSAETALKQPDAIVLTESMRKKYFGDEKAIGKLINSDRRRDFIVTAVIEDFPKNSHFRPDFLEALFRYEESRNTRWVSNNFHTYVVVREGVSPEEFETKIAALVDKYVVPQVEMFLGVSFQQLVDEGSNYGFKVMPLTSIHLHSNLEYELGTNSDITYVYIFSIIAFAILIIASINFMNLSTARSSLRAKEVGIRKTLGSSKGKLIQQFLTESVLLTFIAVVLATVIIKLVLPLFNDISGKSLDINYFDNVVVLPAILIFALIVGLLAGIYPAFVLTSFNPVNVLKSETRMKGKGAWMRSALVIFQFSISIILFVGTFVVYGQLQYVHNKRLGFNKDQLIIVEKTDDIADNIRVFKQKLLDNPNIKGVTNHHTYPGKNFGNSVYQVEGQMGNENHLLWIWVADYDLVDTYQIEMAEGRYFSQDFPTDSQGVVINEKAVKALSIEDPIGKNIVDLGPTPEQVRYLPIIGVMKDFHFESLHTEIRPMMIFPIRFTGRYTAVRIAGQNIRSTIEYIESVWKELAFDQAFEYVFMDEEFARSYEAEQRIADLFTSFSILAIIIACLGLYGLAAFITEQRTKEIGIRKSMGASTPRILLLLVKEFLKWVVIANIIAWPLAYYGMNNWLQDFQYRISLGWEIFIISGIIAAVIAIITVSSQVIRAAAANPADSLRYE